MKSLTKNWKTTLAGVTVAAVGILSATHIINAVQGESIMAVLTAFGLASAKDSNVTGGTTQQ